MNSFISIVQRIVLYMLLFIMAISYHPSIVRMGVTTGLESGTVLSKYILALFAILFFLSIFRVPRYKSKLLVTYAVLIAIIFVTGLIVKVAYNNNEMLAELRSVFIIFVSVFIGWTIGENRITISSTLLVFGLSTLFSGVSQVFTNIGGFTIEDQYLVDSKNSLGAMLASVEIAFIFMWRGQDSRFWRLLSFVLFIVCLAVIITIRARAALLAVLIVTLIYFVVSSKNKGAMIMRVLAFVVFIVIIAFIPSEMSDYVQQSIFAGTQGEDVTSGRMGTYTTALNFIAQNPFLGDIENKTHIAWIHNYIFLNLYNFGLIFSLPVLILYFYLLVYSVKYTIRMRAGYRYLGYTIVIIPFVISMLEPTFPFGPGTVTVFNFILLGMSERAVAESRLQRLSNSK